MVKYFLPLVGLSLSSFCFAQNPLSVHVLNLDNGLPSANVKVVLETQQNNQWVEINSGTTNEQGRITELYPKDTALQKGIYKVTFKTGDWFRQQNQRSFFPEVPVVFVIDGSLDHYHIPLLISPYGYSTYRGN
ncbi:hydroxyisourate hydrolase [Acinetobacter tandoii]|jgi:5-hydroxyisourate hydrolase|uniref:5-hydroxyisourate hydrolase n=1 Tax=Acinetobacter tandoii DSM 14970 = CIP 107469 TaxID=1120927 RepID=R9AWJ8_9GAMM|nr:hydroxyisourate hydrolase [Acinetobacter tandoii]EOR06582.1 hydroxyisourate hydrolase [Acinetobacter tandoii DSM 14970 = CIP 107469]